jgi:protoporphyrinogen oxidase
MSRTVVIAGAGPAGLTAALEMLRRTDCVPLVFESDSQVGGISKTVLYRGNRMDLGGHRFFSKSDWVMNWWQDILPVAASEQELRELRLTYQGSTRDFAPVRGTSASDGRVLLVRPRLSRIYYRRRFFDYPLRLSPAMLANLGGFEAARLGVSYSLARVRPRNPEVTLEDFFVNRFGERLYRTFFKDYTEKVWGVPCREISAEWGAQRVKGLSINKAVLHALRGVARRGSDMAQKGVETSLIERFLYPQLGPGQMWEEVRDRVVAAGGEIHLGHRVVGLERHGDAIHRVQVQDLRTDETRWIACDAFVSTMPLRELMAQLAPEDLELRRVAAGLPYRDFMTAGLVVRRMSMPDRRGGTQPSMTPKDNWIYIQEPDVRLGRLQIFNNWSAYLVDDPDTVSLGLEYFCAEGDDLWSMPDPTFLEFAAQELEQIGLIRRGDVLDGTVVRVPKAYPAYFGEYRNMDRVRDYLSTFSNLFPVGRNGMHRYNNQDHSMLAAKAAVDCLVTGSRDRNVMWSINTEEDYHESRAATATGGEGEDSNGRTVAA